MAAAPDITIPDDIRSAPGDPRVQTFQTDPVLIVMDWPDELKGCPSDSDADLFGLTEKQKAVARDCYAAWINQVNMHLAAGRYVAVRGWEPDCKTYWDVSSIARFKGSMDQKIQYQGKNSSLIVLLF
jgi:hypothetical protein